MTPYNIRSRLRALLALTNPVPVQEVEEPIQAAEEVEEEAAYDIEEVVKLLLVEARALTEKMNGWVPDNELLVKVGKILPQSEESLRDGDTAEILMKIQREYILERFMGDYITRLYSFQEDVAKLDRDDYFKHYIHVGVMISQLVAMMAVATQALVANAFLYKAHQIAEEAKEAQEEETTKEPAEDTQWLTWGIVGGVH